jgi:hypothetical protein
MTNQFSKQQLDSLVGEVNYQQDGFEDEDHSFDIWFTKDQYDKLIELGWTDDDFYNVGPISSDDDDEWLNDHYCYFIYYPYNEDSYYTVDEVVTNFFKQLGWDIECPCNG